VTAATKGATMTTEEIQRWRKIAAGMWIAIALLFFFLAALAATTVLR
jgi:hypothetical protein